MYTLLLRGLLSLVLICGFSAISFANYSGQPITICSAAPIVIQGDQELQTPNSYAWQVLQGSTWVNAPGIFTNADYTPSALVNNTTSSIVFSIRRAFVSAGVTSYDSYYDVTVLPASAISGNTITAPAVTSFCSPGNPAAITGSSPTGGNGLYNYQWQSSTDNVTFTNIPGAIGSDYTPSGVTVTTYYQRVTISGSCVAPSTSNAVKIVIFSTISNNTISAAVNRFCSYSNTVPINGSNPSGGNGAYTYQWQSSTDSVNFTDISNTNSPNYNAPSVTSTTYYRRSVSSGVCSIPTYSNIVGIYVVTPVGNNTVSPPPVTTFCASGGPAVIKGSIPSGGTGNYTYQWQQSTDNVTFTNINNADSVNYTPPVINTTTYYQRLVSSGVCVTPVISNVVTITIVPAVNNNTIAAPSPAIFCSPGIPTTILGSNPSGGGGNYVFQWQNSVDNVNFTDIPNTNSPDYTPPTLTATTYYRRSSTGGSCAAPSISNTVTLTVVAALTNDVINTPTTNSFCSQVNIPLTITGNVPSGGNSTDVYQWQQSTDNVTFTDISGASSPDYSVPNITTTTYYRRNVTSGVCTTPIFSNVVTITVFQTVPIANNTIAAPGTTSFCAPGNPAAINGSNPSGGDGIFSYQWQQSADNVSFTDITGATQLNYTPVSLMSTTYFRRVATSDSCVAPSLSNVVTINIITTETNNVIAAPTVNSFCVPSVPGRISGNAPSGGSGSYTYQWQQSTDNVNFTDIGTNGNQQNYDPPLISSTTYFRRSVISGVCNVPVYSDTVAISIFSAMDNDVITAPAVTAFCVTGTPGRINGNVPTGGGGSYTYQWQQSTDNVTFTDITSATLQYFDPPTISATTYYRRTASSTLCATPIISNVIAMSIVLHPTPPTVLQTPVTVCQGSTATLAVSSPQAGLTYNWYADSTRHTLLFTGVNYPTAAISANTSFYVESSNGVCQSTSIAAAQVNVITPPVVPVLVADSITVCSGSTTTFAVSNPQTGYTYNWYTASTGGSPVFTGTNFPTTALSASTVYYVDATNSQGCVSPSRKAATVTVPLLPPLSSYNIIRPATTTYCATSSSTLISGNLASGGNGTYIYQWQSSADSLTFADVPNTNNPNYTAPALSNTTYYRRTVTSGNCVTPAISNIVGITILPAIANNDIAAPPVTAFCVTGDADKIMGSTPTGANGAYTYQWQQSADNITFTNILANANSKDFDPPVLTSTTYYRRVVTSTACATPSISNIITITILPTPNTPVLTQSTVITCSGSSAVLSVSNQQAGITYNWYADSTKINLLSTGITFTTVALSQNTPFYVDATNGVCSAGSKATVQVNIAPVPVLPVLVNDTVNICSNTTATFTLSNQQIGYTYKWYTAATGGSAISTGSIFTTPVLSASQNYYVEATNTSGCVSTRVAVNANVSILPALANNVISGPSINTFCTTATGLTLPGSGPTGGSGAYSYQWQNSPDGITYTNATGPTATAPSYTTPTITATTYYRRVVTSGSCVAPSTSNAVTIAILPAPNVPVLVQSMVIICSRSSAVLSVTTPQTGITYRWYADSAKTTLLFTGVSYTTDPLTQNTSFYVDASNGTCSAASMTTAQVNIAPLPVSPVLVNDTVTICSGAAATFTLSNQQTGYIYKWYTTATGGSPVFTGTTFTSPVLSASQNYFVEATNTFGCVSPTRVSVTANVPLLLALGNNVISAPVSTFCVATNAQTLSGTVPTGGNGTYTYQWQNSPDGITFTDINSATAPNYTTSTINTTTYYRRTAISGSCVLPLVSNVIEMKIIPYPTVPTPAQASVNVCLGSQASLSVSAQQSGITYNWYADSTRHNLIFTGTSYTSAPLTVNTSFYIEASNGICVSSAVAAVQVNVLTHPANISLVTDSMTICAGSSPTFKIANPQAGYTYNWYATSTGGSAIFSGTSFTTPALSANTTYYAEATNAPACVSPTRVAAVVTVSPLPPIVNNAITAPAIATFCSSGDPANISGSIPTGGNGTYTYQWQSSTDSVTFTDMQGISSKDYDPPVTTTTTYYRRTVISGSCTVPTLSNVVTITILPNTPVSNNMITAPAVTTFCAAGDAANITGSIPSGGNGTYVYQWQQSNDNVTYTNIPGTNFKDYDPPVNTSTIYYRRTVTSGQCTTPVISNIITINILPFPTIPVVSQASVSACSASTATLSIASPQNGLTYNWYADSTKNNLLFSGSSYTTAPLTGNAVFYIESTNGLCSSSAVTAVQVTIVPPPAAPVFAIDTISICSGLIATFNISNPQAGYTYNWYTSTNGGTPIFTGTNYTTPTLSATTTYYVEAVNVLGCVSPSFAAATVIVEPLPQFTVNNASVCQGSSATLSATTSASNINFNWYTAATGGSPIATGSTLVTAPINANTNYYVEATNTITGCASPLRQLVQATVTQPLPAPVVTVGIVTVNSVTFGWTAIPGAIAYQVSSDNGQTFTDPSSGSAGLSHTISGVPSNQSVTLLVRALGQTACQLSANSVAVTGTTLSGGDNVYVPNAFTPNGDGKNDVVHVHSQDIKTINFYVYNQFGGLIFSSTDISVGWDGTYKGVIQPVGVYTYFLKATMVDGSEVSKKGTITLLK